MENAEDGGKLIDADRAPVPPVNPAGVKPVESPVDTKPYDPAKDREGVRGDLAKRLVLLLALIILLLFGVVFVLLYRAAPTGTTPVIGVEDVSAIANALLTPIVGLVGAVVGFYFGAASAENAPNQGQNDSEQGTVR